MGRFGRMALKHVKYSTRNESPVQVRCMIQDAWGWTGDSFRVLYYTCFNAILPNHPTLSLSHRVQKTVLKIKKENLFSIMYMSEKLV